MNVPRLATGLFGMAAGIMVVGYALGWIAKHLAQLFAGVIALASGGLLVFFGTTSVVDELQHSKELSRALKTARKRVREQDLSKLRKSVRQRSKRLRRETRALWR